MPELQPIDKRLVGKTLVECAESIEAHWKNSLDSLWLNLQSDKKQHYFNTALNEKANAFYYLLAVTHQDSDIDPNHIILKTIELVQTDEFDILDFHREISSLKGSIAVVISQLGNDEIDTVAFSSFIRNHLDSFFEEVAHDTSVVYEHYAERGSQSFIVLDFHGTVTFSNKSARELLGKSVKTGARFVDCIAKNEQSEFEQILKDLDARENDAGILIDVNLDSAFGVTGIFDLEVAKLEKRTRYSHYYLSIATASQALGLGNQALEDFSQGIIRINAERRAVYANDAAQKILGPFEGSITSLYIHDLFEGKNREIIDNEITKREKGELSVYEIELTRPISREKIPVSIHAIPELNAMGTYIGSVAIVEDLTIEKLSREVIGCMSESRSWQANLEKLLTILMRCVDADIIGITRYTNDLCHSAMIGSLMREGGQYVTEKRWFPLNSALREWISLPGYNNVDDFPSFVETEKMKELRDDADIQNAILFGIKSILVTPILNDGSNKAAISFSSKHTNHFNEAHEKLIASLPIAEVVLSAIQRRDRENKIFQFKFMTELSRCDSFKEIAEYAVKELAKHYKWDNASLFDVAVDLDVIALFEQETGTESEYRLKKDHQQPSGVGLLGQAVREERMLYARDVRDHGNYHEGHPDIKSEVIIPIFSRAYRPKRVFWLLNIEDSHTDFVNDDELAELKVIAEHIEFVVNRLMDRTIYECAVKESGDGILVTDANGNIRMANPAAVEALEYADQQDLVNKNLGELFADSEKSRMFLAQNIRDSHKVILNTKTGRDTLPVLMSKLKLPVEISDRYFNFKNLISEMHLANLDTIEDVVSEVASQIKTPVSLLQGLLNRLQKSSSRRVDIGSYVNRARSLLKDVELTYDRLVYSDSIGEVNLQDQALVDIEQMFGELNRELTIERESSGVVDSDMEDTTDYDSTADNQLIDIHVKGKPKKCLADRHQIRFVLESLVSYQLRNLPPNEKIDVSIEQSTSWVNVLLKANILHYQGVDLDLLNPGVDRVMSEIRFGLTAVKKIIVNHHGVFNAANLSGKGNTLKFEFRLPVVE